MLFASFFGEGLLNGFIIIAIGGWCIQRWLKKIDTDGSVKDAARKGVINQIGKWLK